MKPDYVFNSLLEKKNFRYPCTHFYKKFVEEEVNVM